MPAPAPGSCVGAHFVRPHSCLETAPQILYHGNRNDRDSRRVFSGKTLLKHPLRYVCASPPSAGRDRGGESLPWGPKTRAGEKTVSTDDGGSSMDLNTRKILSLFASILFTIPVYIILHEGGHALIALSAAPAHRIQHSGRLYALWRRYVHRSDTVSFLYCGNAAAGPHIHRLYAALSGRRRSPSFIEFFLFCFP